MKHFGSISRLILCIILTVAAFGSPPPMEAQTGGGVYRVFTTKTFHTASNRTDTSSTLSTKYYPYVEIATYVSGTDSCFLRSEIDYLVGSTWVLAAKRDTIRFGDATTLTGKAKGFYVLHPSQVPLMPGSTSFRIRNILVPYASADSVSATSYTQTMLLRPPDPR